MSIVKYRVRDVAADFGMEAKQIAQILSKFFEKPRSNMQVLTEEQLNVLFDYMTQQNQISSIEQVFAEAMARRQEMEKQAAAEQAAREAQQNTAPADNSGDDCGDGCVDDGLTWD